MKCAVRQLGNLPDIDDISQDNVRCPSPIIGFKRSVYGNKVFKNAFGLHRKSIWGWYRCEDTIVYTALSNYTRLLMLYKNYAQQGIWKAFPTIYHFNYNLNDRKINLSQVWWYNTFLISLKTKNLKLKIKIKYLKFKN